MLTTENCQLWTSLSWPSAWIISRQMTIGKIMVRISINTFGQLSRREYHQLATLHLQVVVTRLSSIDRFTFVGSVILDRDGGYVLLV
jgi:hypothetical protein